MHPDPPLTSFFSSFGCIFQVRALMPKADSKKSQITNDIIAGSIGGTVGTIVNT